MNPLRFAAMLALAGATTVAQAELVDLRFTGSVHLTTLSSVAPGTPVSGRIVYDDDMTGADIFSAKVFFWMASPTTFEVKIGDREASVKNLGVYVFPYEHDESIRFIGAVKAPNGHPDEEASLQLELARDLNPGDARLLGDKLPNRFQLSDFDSSVGVLFLTKDKEQGIGFQLTSITAVPEPSAAVAVLSGLAVMAGVARMRRGQRRVL